MKLRSILKLETCFHVLAICVVIKAIVMGGNLTEATAAAGSISLLGRAIPTEELDRKLDIPLGEKKE